MKQQDSRTIKVGQIYRHYKGDYYVIELLGRHSETGEKMVVYRALYGDGAVWCRPLELFLGESPIYDPSLSDPDRLSDQELLRTQRYRFELQNIPSKRD